MRRPHTTRLGSPGDPCPPPTEETGAECPNFYQAFPTILETHAFSYDSAGNRRDNGGSYTTGNRITGFASCSYATDADGNVTRRTCGSQKDSIVWDAANRPSQIRANNDQTIVDLNYDAFGRLAKQVVNGTVRYLLWDGDRLFAELNGSDGSTRAEYSYYPGLDHLHALIVGGTHYYAHADGLGNVIALTDTAKVLKRSYDYDAWGQPTGGTDWAGLSGADRARFKGALWFGEGGTELYYMRNRWYEAKTGRFLSEDPIGLEGGINLYTFAENDPVNKSDPTGKLTCGWVTEQYWTENAKGDGLELKTREVYICSVGTSGEASWRSSRGWGFGALSDAWAGWPGTGTATVGGPFAEVTMKRNPAWVGCRVRKIEFRSLDSHGQMGTWAVKLVRVAPGVRIRGVPVTGPVGIYVGAFKSGSYVTPLPAFGQILCAVGIGLFEAGAGIS